MTMNDIDAQRGGVVKGFSAEYHAQAGADASLESRSFFINIQGIFTGHALTALPFLIKRSSNV